MPDDVACSQQGNCGCGPGGNDSDYFLSYRALGETLINIDIVVDDTFPCDLFEFYFGVPRNAYHIVKASATVIPNCDSLGPYSTGLFWVSGAECKINANTQVGSHDAPIMLISAAPALTCAAGRKSLARFIFLTAKT